MRKARLGAAIAAAGCAMLACSVPAAAQGAGPNRQPNSQSQPSRDDEGARSLLQDALADLAQGRTQPGQRLLELLIARYPDSAAAAEARRRLARLYAGESDRGASGGPVSPGTHGDPAPPARPAAVLAPKNWRIGVRRNTAAEEDFRAKAGDRIFFSPGSAELGGRARAVLQAQAQWLNRYTALEVVVEGHADDPGNAQMNRDLARRRAEAVRLRLIEEGVAEERLAVSVRGNADRVAECPEPSCTAQNRRVVTSLIEVERSPVAEQAKGAGSRAGLREERPGMSR